MDIFGFTYCDRHVLEDDMVNRVQRCKNCVFTKVMTEPDIRVRERSAERERQRNDYQRKVNEFNENVRTRMAKLGYAEPYEYRILFGIHERQKQGSGYFKVGTGLLRVTIDAIKRYNSAGLRATTIMEGESFS